MALPDDYNYPIPKQGFKTVGLDAATPTGTALVTIADFTGAVDTSITTSALLPLSGWQSRTDSQTNGTSWQFNRRGRYQIQAYVRGAGAGTFFAGLLQSSAAPPADPTFASANIFASTAYTGAAGDVQGKSFSGTMVLTDLEVAAGVAAVFRLQISNGAGAAPTILTVAECGVRVIRTGDVQSVA